MITKLDNDWKHVKNVSRTTVNKLHSDNEATTKFKIDMLISEHSPIRLIRVQWSWRGIKSWIATHWSRHKFECFISTQRDDRINLDRNKSPQDTPVNMDNEANAQQLIDVWRKRLCYQTHKETREYAESLKYELIKSDSDELGFVLVPNCIYRNGCPEIQNCGYFNKLVSKDIKCSSTNIRERYTAYNNLFLEDK